MIRITTIYIVARLKMPMLRTQVGEGGLPTFAPVGSTQLLPSVFDWPLVAGKLRSCRALSDLGICHESWETLARGC
jgi:hypothetical protein